MPSSFHMYTPSATPMPNTFLQAAGSRRQCMCCAQLQPPHHAPQLHVTCACSSLHTSVRGNSTLYKNSLLHMLLRFHAYPLQARDAREDVGSHNTHHQPHPAEFALCLLLHEGSAVLLTVHWHRSRRPLHHSRTPSCSRP
jgi:hypothetical protein